MRHHSPATLIAATLLAMMPAGMAAQRRSTSEALSVASSHLASQDATVLRWAQGQTYGRAAYIVADSRRHRAVVVAADERMTPILAELGHIPTQGTTLPPALEELMEQYASEYDALQAGDVEAVVPGAPLAAMPDVAPLLKATWGQSSPYNDDCPLNCPSGCVATAMAQIMYHYGYPLQGRGSHSYRTASRHISQSMDFGSTYFDWQNMLPAYGRSGSRTQRQAVATLMHACGVSVDMDYDVGGSGALAFDVPYAVITFFGYNPNTECLLRDYYSADEWNQRLAAELTAGRPVIYCGHDPRDTAGHAFVVDGCRGSDSKVHVNWGWDGDYDGYYVLSSLNPASYRFTTHQTMVAQFCPDVAGTHEDVAYADRFTVSGSLRGGDIVQGTLQGLAVCAASTSVSISQTRFNGYVGMGIWDAGMHFVGTLYEQDIVGWAMADEHDVSMRCTLRMAGLTDGTYYLAPYVRATDAGEPTRVRTLHAQTDIVAFTVSGDDILPDEPEPTPDAGGIVWQEGFESGDLPSTIVENSIQGSGEWEVVQVLFSQSNAMPEAATGHGYALLRNRGIGLSGRRVVNRLVTDDIALPTGQRNSVAVQVRRHSTSPNSDDALSLYFYTSDGGWQQLAETSVLNASVWEVVTAELPAGISRCRIAVEGSLGIGATLFIDDICVRTTSTTTSIQHLPMTKALRQQGGTYDISGQRLQAPRVPGIYIINGTKKAVQ